MNRSARWFYLISLLLLAPALLINLGLLAFIDDEGIRSLVALEMDLSGNLVTPTLHGAYYYKKPPLYNWILLAWYQIAGPITEFKARIPTVLALLAYAGSLFFILKPKYGTKTAFLNALVLITCGRILFWDSMLALIDMTFSWVMFGLFMVVYHFFEKEQYRPLFLLAYLLTAIGFLLKGLPAIVFLGTTLLAWFVYRRRFRALFCWSHLLGGAIFLLLVGGYYLLYNEYNSLENVFTTLFTESSKRTAARFGWWETLKHIGVFPLEMVYHFLPWSLLIVLFFHRRIGEWLRADRFITFCMVAFLANILVYWASPEVFPRYLLMHAPLIFICYIYLYKRHREQGTWHFRILDRLFLGMGGLLFLGSFLPLFLPQTQGTAYLIPKTLAGATLAAWAVWNYWKKPAWRLHYLAVLFLVFRITFNFFVLPDRNQNDFGDVIRQESIRIGTQYRDQPLYVYEATEMEPAISFYLTNARGAIIPRVEGREKPEGLYIIDHRGYPDLAYEPVDSLPLRHGDRPVHVIGKITQSK